MICHQCLYQHFWSTIRNLTICVSLGRAFVYERFFLLEIAMLWECPNNSSVSKFSTLFNWRIYVGISCHSKCVKGFGTFDTFFSMVKSVKLVDLWKLWHFWREKICQKFWLFWPKKEKRKCFQWVSQHSCLCFLPKEFCWDQEWIVLKRVKCILVKMFCINE